MTSPNVPHDLTVLIVDDHAIVRAGYRRLLESDGRIASIGEAGDGDGALAEFRRLNPDVVVLDVTLAAESGLDLLGRMRLLRPSSGILMFSMHEDPVFAERSVRAGAMGYVTKASAPHVLVEAVHAVAEGRKYLSPEMAQELALRNVVEPGVTSELSPRELEVLRLLVDGVTVKHIAGRLNLTAKTVANLQSSIRHKLGAETPVQFLHIGARLLQRVENSLLQRAKVHG